MTLPRALFLGGPTAAGKSTLAMRLADALPVEFVSADSVQIYRGFDIGSASPSAEERARVPHHLVDIVDPSERYSAARFREDALAAIRAIGERGRLPVVVGGTGLYLRSLLYGLFEGPPADDAMRTALETRAEEEGREALHASLAQVDPESAARLHPNDVRRVVRALEVHALTGTPLSAFHRAHGLEVRQVAGPVWCLRWERDTLRARIRSRAESMLAAGWVEEVRDLLAAGVPANAPAFEAVGYKEVLAHVHGALAPDAMLDKISTSTWRLAKRQLTWFRGQHRVRWIDGASVDASWPELLDEARALHGGEAAGERLVGGEAGA